MSQADIGCGASRALFVGAAEQRMRTRKTGLTGCVPQKDVVNDLPLLST